MFLPQKLDFCYLTLILLILLNQKILFSVAQQNFLDTSGLADKTAAFVDKTANLMDKTADQLLTTNLWTKNLNLSTDSVVNRFSNALPQSIRQLESRSQLVKATPISCYECNSHLDPDCITHPEKFEKNCTNSFQGTYYIGCRKIDQWVDYDGGEELKAHHRVIRQCAADGDISKPCYYRAGYGGRINTCFCDRDLCNSGLSLKVINTEFMFIVMFSIFLIFRLTDKL